MLKNSKISSVIAEMWILILLEQNFNLNTDTQIFYTQI